MKDFQIIQDEQVEWVKHNFPHRETWQPLVGITEELGELLVAWNSLDEEGVKDSCADTMIFICDYLTGMGIKISDIPYSEMFDELMFNRISNNADALLMVLGKLNHHHLKFEQHIRLGEDHLALIKTHISSIISYLRNIRKYYKGEDDLLEITSTVWAVVKLRDWQKDRING